MYSSFEFVWIFNHMDISVFYTFREGVAIAKYLLQNPLIGYATYNNQNGDLTSTIHMLPG